MSERCFGMRVGTAHFVDRAAAVAYYAAYGFDAAAVDDKLARGEIHLGKPARVVAVIDGRYHVDGT